VYIYVRVCLLYQSRSDVQAYTVNIRYVFTLWFQQNLFIIWMHEWRHSMKNLGSYWICWCVVNIPSALFKTLGWLFDIYIYIIQGILLPNYTGIIISQYIRIRINQSNPRCSPREASVEGSNALVGILGGSSVLTCLVRLEFVSGVKPGNATINSHFKTGN